MELRPNEIPLGTARDLSQEKFGMVQPLYRVTGTKSGTRWHCKCDCGKEFDAFAGNLTRGRTSSCGCARTKNSAERMINQRFGKLVVVQRNSRAEPGRTFWDCLCDCGNICVVRGDQLTRGVTTSCGCLKDLVGETFGELTVLRSVGIAEGNGMKIWECKCTCGNIIKVRTGNLQSGHTTSCGCKSLVSKGEEKISTILKEVGIKFERQKIFDSCRFDTGYPAKFDFYVDDKYLIEYDGSQHFECRESGWNTAENLQKTQERDRIKTLWAKKNNLPLIRIPYTRYKELCIDDLLLKSSTFIVGEELHE